MFRRGAVYCTRYVVPPRLRPLIGKSDLGCSLNTRDLKEANRIFPAWLADAQTQIDAAEESLANESKAGRRLPAVGVNAEALQKAQEDYEREHAAQDAEQRWECDRRLDEAEAVADQLKQPDDQLSPG
ncbi:DUF6538 domain-containing protein [Sphingobium sp.]|uniref:DUF6538 domain-containing protein n=1 Tax=Sphingobium sp. TaxID=1912891 RepID=UPI0039C8E403